MGVLPLREGTKLLTLTAVVYEAGDDLGKVLALVSMVPVYHPERERERERENTHTQRNNSSITDVFTGQLMSELVC
eukprot:COSAG05_NODE_11549_length_508_cov_0.696822_1_plen_75_part_10